MQINNDLLDFIEKFFELVLERRAYKTMLHLVLSTAMRLTDSQMGNIFSYSRKTGKLELVLGIGFEQISSPKQLKIDEGAAGIAAKKKHAILIKDYAGYVAGLARDEQKRLEPFGKVISSSIGVPLISNGFLIGSFAISRGKNHQTFDDAQIEIAEFFSKIASLLLSYSFYLYKHQNKIVDMKNRVEFFKNRSNTDPLTNILNRGALEDYLEKILNSTVMSAYSIVMADIDRFKLINDSFGHLAGDEVLKQVASIINSNIRKTDKLFRYGGEEFIIVLKEPVDVAVKVAQKIRLKFEKGFLQYGDKHIKYTISFGVAPILIYSDSVLDCIERADKALYAAKSNGRNRVEVRFS